MKTWTLYQRDAEPWRSRRDGLSLGFERIFICGVFLRDGYIVSKTKSILKTR